MYLIDENVNPKDSKRRFRLPGMLVSPEMQPSTICAQWTGPTTFPVVQSVVSHLSDQEPLTAHKAFVALQTRSKTRWRRSCTAARFLLGEQLRNGLSAAKDAVLDTTRTQSAGRVEIPQSVVREPVSFCDGEALAARLFIGSRFDKVAFRS